MNNFKEFFKGKKITLMGLGLLGRGVGDALFLAESGAQLTITDLKSEEQLKESLKKLKKFDKIKYVLGQHRLEDFRNCDLVLKAAGVPLNSPYIKEARKNKIPIKMSAAIFTKLCGLPVIGITGTRGKSTVTHLIGHILKLAGRKVILGGNVRGVSNLQLLKKVRQSDLAVLELDSWQLQGFGEEKISPHISVFTNFLSDHVNYYKDNLKQYFIDKSQIFKYQKKGDTLILGEQIKKIQNSIRQPADKIQNSKVIVVKKNILPKSWEVKIPGEHNRENIACAMMACRCLGVSEEHIKNGVESFVGVPGRLEFLRSINGIKIYNDNSSTTPEATIVALRAVGDQKNRAVVLIIGGDNKSLDTTKLIKEIPKFCSKVVLFKERGTDLIRDQVFKLRKKGIDVYEEEGLKKTVQRAFFVAQSGDTILYSPAFSSFGKYFKNEYDRGDQLIKIVKKLKVKN